MKIKDLAKSWPPGVVASAGNVFSRAELSDKVTSVSKHADHLSLNCRKVDGQTYVTALRVPANLLDKAIIEITGKLELTLEELGNIEIS